MRVEEGTGVLNYVACGTSSKLNDPENTPTACSQAMFTASLESEVNTDDSSSEICEISPLHVLSSIHQSGVNCLHISDMNHCQSFNNGFLYYLLSGGDDQALHCLGFDLTLLPTSSESQIKAVNVENSTTKFEDIKNLNHCKQNKNYRIRFLYHDRVASAHNSAVKGKFFKLGSLIFLLNSFVVGQAQVEVVSSLCLNSCSLDVLIMFNNCK